VTSEAMWFGTPGSPMFGWLHRGPGEVARGGVLICPPLGEEYKASHLTMRVLAEGLEAEGFVALRMDYRGTGDSSGQPLLHGWDRDLLDDVRTGVEFLRSSGLRFIVVIGMRMGATLAAAALRDGVAVDGLVLWDPCESSDSFLREQVLLRSTTARQDAELAPEGWIDGPESLFPVDFTVELVPGSGELPQAGSTVVLSRLDRPVGRSVRRLIAGLDAAERPALGQTELLEVPSIFRTIPTLSVNSITSWIVTLPPDDQQTNTVKFKPESGHVDIEVSDGIVVRERGVRFCGGGLFGILTERPDADGDLPVVIFLSVANDHRAATGRLWVDLARRLAHSGFQSLRLDLSGMGDSDPRLGQPPQVIATTAHLEDIVDVACDLRANDPTDIVLVGLSSSAYMALEGGYAVQAKGVCAINAGLHFVPPEMADGTNPMDDRRRFCFPPSATWSNLRGRSMVNVLKRTFPQLSWRVAHLLSDGGAPVQRLGELAAAGTALLLVSGERETLILRQSSPRRFAGLSRRPRVRLRTVNNLEHHLPGTADRAQVLAMVDEFLTDTFLDGAGSEPVRLVGTRNDKAVRA
jgi:alpha-beta hydrolase superfamily lysophospholipase